MTMYCKNCGTECVNGQMCCPKCGMPLTLPVNDNSKGLLKKKNKPIVIGMVLGLGGMAIVALFVLLVGAGIWLGSKSDEHWLTQHEFYYPVLSDGRLTMVFLFDENGLGTAEARQFDKVVQSTSLIYKVEGDQIEVSVIGGETHKYHIDKKAGKLKGTDSNMTFMIRDKK